VTIYAGVMARVMFGDDPGSRYRVARDGRTWRIGTQTDVAWIASGTTTDRTVTAAIPPVFDAYATVVLPASDEERDRHDRALAGVLTEQSPDQPWWLGYLDTGADDIVFPDAPMVRLYPGWPYVLVEAGPEQAATWRMIRPGTFWIGALPNLMFPADHSWLVSTLWDDGWSCIGGSADLVRSLLAHPDLEARSVDLGQDATPPGHRAF
jgi:hypothetical protein